MDKVKWNIKMQMEKLKAPCLIMENSEPCYKLKVEYFLHHSDRLVSNKKISLESVILAFYFILAW